MDLLIPRELNVGKSTELLSVQSASPHCPVHAHAQLTLSSAHAQLTLVNGALTELARPGAPAPRDGSFVGMGHGRV